MGLDLERAIFLETNLDDFGDHAPPHPSFVRLKLDDAKGDELDPRPLMASLAGHGHPLFLPAILGDRQPLQFRGWRDGEALKTGSFGTKEPLADAPKGAPDIVIVPLLAFDEGGYRLGYGKGFFDMTLAELRRRGPNVLSVGFSYEVQRSDDLPRDDWDEPLDWIVTERKARRIQ